MEHTVVNCIAPSYMKQSLSFLYLKEIIVHFKSLPITRENFSKQDTSWKVLTTLQTIHSIPAHLSKEFHYTWHVTLAHYTTLATTHVP